MGAVALVVVLLAAAGIATAAGAFAPASYQGTCSGFDPSKGTYPGSPTGSANHAGVTTTTTTAPAYVPEPVEVFTGRGDDVITLATPRAFAILDFTCKPCSGNVIVKSDNAVHVNEIGSYAGRTIYGQSGGSTTAQLTRLQITATGAWTLVVGGIDSARQETSVPVRGTGDDVVLLLNAPDVATFTYQGRSNFVVWVTSATARKTDLVVNAIGSYSGKVLLPGSGRMLVVVTADGAWSMT